MSDRSCISIEHFKMWFAQSRHSLRKTITQEFREPKVRTTPAFDGWWHTNCSFLMGRAPFKKFLEHIGFERSEFGHRRHNDSSSFSSDNGFGIAGGIEDIPEGEVDQEMVPVEASPIAMIIHPSPPRRQSLRVSQKRGATSPSESASKRSKVAPQPKEVIPTKRYLEPSAELPTSKKAKVTKKHGSRVSSSDEDTDTNTDILIHRGKTKGATKETLFYQRKEVQTKVSQTLGELPLPNKAQMALSDEAVDLSISPCFHQEVVESLPVQKVSKDDPQMEFPLSIELPAFAKVVANLARSKVMEPLQILKRDPPLHPLTVLEQGSLLTDSTSTTPPTSSFGEQDLDMTLSSSYQVTGIAHISRNDPGSPSSPIDLPLVAFDISFFKSQLERFCNQIVEPIPLISSNPLESLEQLLSPSLLLNSPSFKIKHVLSEEEIQTLKSHLRALNHLGLPTLFEHHLTYHFEVCYQALILSQRLPSSVSSTLQEHLKQFGDLISVNQFLIESTGTTVQRVKQLEARALQTASHLSLYQARKNKLAELDKRMKWLQMEIEKVRNEIAEVSIGFPELEGEVLRDQSILSQLIPSLREEQKRKAAHTSLLDVNYNSLRGLLSIICDVISPFL